MKNKLFTKYQVFWRPIRISKYKNKLGRNGIIAIVGTFSGLIIVGGVIVGKKLSRK